MSTKRRKKGTKKIITSFILLLISVSLFVGATFAWFTDTATVKGNKVFAGNLFIDVVADFNTLKSLNFTDATTEGELTESVSDSGKYTFSGLGDEGVALERYSRTEGDITSNYYKITNVEAPFFALYNVEPGQAYHAKFHVLNSGDLAVKYTAGFQISYDDEGHLRSYTGLETLDMQHEIDATDPFGVYHNAYQVQGGVIGAERTPGTYDTGGTGVLSDDEFNRRLKKLSKMQKDADGNDIGGHLEDVLEVYAVDKELVDSNGNPLRSTLTKEIEVDGERKKANYIGTVKQLINISDPFFVPEPDEEAIYEEVRENIEKLSTGYLLPQETLRNPETDKFDEGGVSVNIYGSLTDYTSSEQLGVRRNVREIGECEYIIYMPESADNKYQNASLFLDMGVTGSQVDFEFDGLSYMLYDYSFAPDAVTVTMPATGKTIQFPEADDTVKYRVLTSDNETKIATLISTTPVLGVNNSLTYGGSVGNYRTFTGTVESGAASADGAKYEASSLAAACNDYYLNGKNSTNEHMHHMFGAIVRQTSIDQDIYSLQDGGTAPTAGENVTYSYNSEANTQYINKQHIGATINDYDYYIWAPSFDEIKNITGNSEQGMGIAFGSIEKPVLLRDAIVVPADSEKKVLVVKKEDGVIKYGSLGIQGGSNTGCSYIMFQIDLSAPDCAFEILD